MNLTKVKPFVCPAALFVALCLTAFAQALAQGGRFAIQLGASPDHAEAETMLKEAQAQNLAAYLIRSNVPGKGIFYRIRVGNYASRAAAEKAAQQFKASGALSAFMIATYEAPLVNKQDAEPTPTAEERARQAALIELRERLAQQSGAAFPGDFSVKGLTNEKLLTSLYRGEFLDIPFDRDNVGFVTLFEAYMNFYARRCSAYLPPNKVEMTRRECATERETRNGFGTVVDRYCVEWVTVRTGLYADPEMYEAKLILARLKAADSLRDVFALLGQKDPVGGMLKMAGNAQAAISDMDALFQMNACASPGLKRFQENLRLFALNKQLGGRATTSAVVTPPPGTPFKDQNYTKLAEDLIFEQSKTWMMNQFVSGSVGVRVSSRDDKGRPSEIMAGYVYNGYNGRSRGSVTLTFTDGLPECMYFFDFPTTCRTPNRRIVAAYANGDYKDDALPDSLSAPASPATPKAKRKP